MRAVYMALLGLVVVGLFANCAKKDDTKKGEANMAASCYYIQTSQNASGPRNYCAFNYAVYPGFSNYSANSFYGSANGGLNGCPVGQTAVYSDQKGLGCVQTQNVDYGGDSAVYGLSSVSGVFVLAGGRMTGMAATYGATAGLNSFDPYGSGSATVLRACDFGNDPCPDGQTCRSPIAYQQNTGMGICYF